MRRGVVAAVLFAAGGVAAAPACTSLAAGESCFDWVIFDTPADAVEDADVVIRATVAESAGTVELWGTRANAWRLDVEEVLAGSMLGVLAGEELEVVSTPFTCGASGAYPDGDRLDTREPVVVFVEDDTTFDVVRTLSPYDGVVAPAPDDGLPAAWPPGQHHL
jgi:hypothetical protein